MVRRADRHAASHFPGVAAGSLRQRRREEHVVLLVDVDVGVVLERLEATVQRFEAGSPWAQ
jgi:hypothetical protein